MAGWASVGRPWQLERSGGWALVRPLGTEVDALAVPPQLFCDRWEHLAEDLDGLAHEGAVSFVGLVYDDDVESSGLQVVGSARPQYVATPDAPWSKTARRNARDAARLVEVRRLDDPTELRGDVLRLYEHLRQRHGIAGADVVPPRVLDAQLEVNGAVAFAAERAGKLVAFVLWFRQSYGGREWAVYQLGVSSSAGYEAMASYALFAESYALFRSEGVDLLDLGRTPRDGRGLAEFKLRLGARETASYPCGRVLRPEAYERLVAARGRHQWFPAYRAPGEV